MALPVINTEDFTGFVNISQSTYNDEDFQFVIDAGIIRHLRSLLGDSAYIDIRDNARAVYTALFARVDWTNSDGDTVICDSLTDVLKMLIYADWTYQSHVTDTAVGIVMNENENSTGPTGGIQASMGVSRLARASEYWENICTFIEFYRKQSRTITSVDVTDPNNPVCTIADPAFLEDGNEIEILGVSYVAASVTATSFAVNAAGLGSSFVNQTATWKPLEKVKSDLGSIDVGFL